MMNVPLLPAALFPEAEKIIENEIDKVKHIDKNILIFFDYFKDEWLSKPEHVSVYNAPNNTNDSSESFNRLSNGIIVQEHPDIWTLISE